MAVVTRSSIVTPGDTVVLKAQFNGSDGSPSDLDAFPSVTVIQPTGAVAIGPTSIGVSKLETGLYTFSYKIGLGSTLGVWSDVWSGTLDGFDVSGSFNFMVYTTQMPAVNTDGYLHLGDDPGFNFSQVAISNINKLVKVLRARLNSGGKHRGVDEYGNEIFTDCDIFTVDQLVTFLGNSLSAFNLVPHFTEFTFEDSHILKHFGEVIVQHAHLCAMASKALIERGREFNITDNGLGFQPPSVADMLNTQYQNELSNWFEKVKMVKKSMPPGPYALGTLRVIGMTPAIMRLRHLRARQIF